SGCRKTCRIGGLMIRGSIGQWNEKGWQSGNREFRERARTSARYRKGGPAVRSPQALQRRNHVGGDSSASVVIADGLQFAATGLMKDLDAVAPFFQLREERRNVCTQEHVTA